MTKRQLRWWFGHYNRLYFDGRLKVRNINYSPGLIKRESAMAMTLTWWCHRKYFMGPHKGKISRRVLHHDILFDLSLRPLWKVLKMCLLHEMAHMATPGDGHGPRFQRQMLRLHRAGAFWRLT